MRTLLPSLVVLCAALSGFGAAPGRVTILHTNDSHTHVDDGAVPFAQIAAEVRRARAAGGRVILADAGDFVQGTAMGGYDGGNVRADIPAGEVTYKTLRMVQPFGGDIGVVEASGQQILDALEFGAQACGAGECGGFLHVAGLTYAVDREIKPSMKVDASGTWVRGPFGGKYRVHSVKVYDRATGAWSPLDLGKTYRVVGNAFTLVDGGDGFAMFRNTKIVNNAIAMDYLVLAEYAQNFAKDSAGVAQIASSASPLKGLKDYPCAYECPTGSGRIVFGKEPNK